MRGACAGALDARHHGECQPRQHHAGQHPRQHHWPGAEAHVGWRKQRGDLAGGEGARHHQETRPGHRTAGLLGQILGRATAAWRGAAAYRDGDYAKAADEYAHADSADGAYNRGNALAQLGRYEEAIAAYDDALKHAPDMPDAVANRKIVQDALKRQQQQQQNQQGQNDQQKNGDDKKQGDPQQKSGEGDSQKEDQDSKQQNGDESKQGDSKDGKDSQQQGKDSQSQDGKSLDAQKNDASASDNQKQPSQDGDSKSQQQGDDQQSASPSPQDAQQAQADAKQREALSQSVDQALAKEGKQGDKDGERKSQVAVPAEDAATREKRQALDQWLQRVPDDPGGLLRRKFMLEYQRRQQGGGDGR